MIGHLARPSFFEQPVDLPRTRRQGFADRQHLGRGLVVPRAARRSKRRSRSLLARTK
jgi:hypothetical protein